MAHFALEFSINLEHVDLVILLGFHPDVHLLQTVVLSRQLGVVFGRYAFSLKACTKLLVFQFDPLIVHLALHVQLVND